MKNLSKSLFDEKLWKFLLVGVLNTLVGNGLMFLLYHTTPMGYWMSTAVSYVLASVMSYFLNRHFTFKFKEKGFRPAFRFALNIAVCYLLAYGLAQPLTAAALSGSSESTRDTVAMLVGMCLFTGLNYLGQRFFAFKEQSKDTPLRPERKLGLSALVWSFLIPTLVIGFAFAVQGVFPFGDRQALAHDMWHQYYPFFVDFRSKLLDGSSMIYSQTAGLGAGYVPLYAYYLATPLNFLSALVPETMLLEFFTMLTVFKIGFAGFSFAIFLRRTFGRYDLTVVPFAVGYALCSFIMGYYWNTMWLDVIMLVPMVTAGAISLMRYRRWRLYVLSLAVAMWCNYYVGLFLCIFQVLVFLGYNFAYWDNFKGFFVRLFRMFVFSLLGVGMAAVLLIPAYLGLQQTYSAINKFPTGLSLNIADTQDWPGVLDAFLKVMSNQLVGTTPTAMNGLPNIYSGTAAVFLAGVYVTNRRFRLRERIGAVILLLFFVASFIFRQLDYVWHGMHFPNMLPYRFGFLYSFVLLTMAFRAYSAMDSIQTYHSIMGLVGVILVSLCGIYGDGELWMVGATAALGVILAAAFILEKKTIIPKKAVAGLIIILFVMEGMATAILGVIEAGTSSRSTYATAKDAVQEVLETIDDREKDVIDLPRTELSKYQTLNDPALLGYHGVSIFSSASLKNVSDFTLHMGLASWPASNRYVYMQSSPFTNLLLNIKYIINREGGNFDPIYTDKVAEIPLSESTGKTVAAYQVNSYLPMGFVMRPEIMEYDVNGSRAFPMTVQNKLFKLATGIEEPLYEPIYPMEARCDDQVETPKAESSNVYYYDATELDKDPKVQYSFIMDKETYFCLYLQTKNVDTMHVLVNDEELCDRNVKVGSLLALGVYEKGDKITISFTGKAETRGKVNLQAASLNNDVFLRGREVLSQSVLRATEAGDGYLCGEIDVEESGIFYTSIPYEPGWTATMDGEAVEITPVGEAFIAFPVRTGSHTIELRFSQPGGTVGMGITMACVVLFIILCVLVRAVPEKKPVKVIDVGYEEPDSDMDPIEDLLSDPDALTDTSDPPYPGDSTQLPDLKQWMEETADKADE